MDATGAYRSSLYQRTDDYFQPTTRGVVGTKPLFTPGGRSTQVLAGLNALSILAVVSWVVFARIRRRVLRMVNRFLMAYLPPIKFDAKSAPQTAGRKHPSPVANSLSQVYGRRHSRPVTKKDLEELADGDWQPAPGVGWEAACRAEDSVTSEREAAVDDDDLEDYEVILKDDAFGEDENAH